LTAPPPPATTDTQSVADLPQQGVTPNMGHPAVSKGVSGLQGGSDAPPAVEMKRLPPWITGERPTPDLYHEVLRNVTR